MGEVKASDPVVAAANSVTSVSNVTMCEESEDVHRGHRAEVSVCPDSAAADSIPPSSSSLLESPSLGAGDSEDGPAVVTELDCNSSTGDSGHGTNPNGQIEQVCNQVSVSTVDQTQIIFEETSPADVVASISHVGSPEEFTWINGGASHPTVMEPVAINPETGFTTVLVDTSGVGVGAYSHGPPTPWPPGGFAIPSPHLHTHPHPPPHFHLHPHAFVSGDMAPGDYSGYMPTGYDPVHSPHYETVNPLFHDPSLHHQHLTANPAHAYSSQKNMNGRSAHRNSRGSSVSPKRPHNRSTSQNNGSAPSQGHRRALNTSATGGSGGNGRYTPSPSSGGSRGSSPGQTSQQIPPPQASSTVAGTMPHCPAAACLPGPSSATPLTSGQHVVHLHVNLGETVSLQMGGQVQVIQGPAMVRMVSTGSPPVPLPVQVPPGHVLQQIVDERGTLRHVILSPGPPPGLAAGSSSSSGSSPNPPMGVLPLATPPPPPHFHGSTHSHTVGQPPPSHIYGANHQGGYVGPQGGYSAQYGNPPMPPNLINHSHPTTYNLSATSNRANEPSPPPANPINFQNERAQRQYNKLKKKLDSRSKGNSVNVSLSTHLTSTPPTSPKKDNNNVQKLKDHNQNGVSSLLSPAQENGQEVVTEMVEQDSVTNQVVGDLKLPEVVDVTARNAMVRWHPLETVIGDVSEPKIPCKELDISYELAFGEKGKEAKSMHSHVIKECEYRLENLRPGCDYSIRLCALVNHVKVRESPLVEFRTTACPPDAPFPPKVHNRSRNSVLLRWIAPADNGSHITEYILECDNGSKSQKFNEVYRGRNKQFSIGKLQPSTCYTIRLAASNEMGVSEWSEEVNVTTMGAPPPPPSPPSLVEATSSSLLLAWSKIDGDLIYTLQYSDPTSGHGFLNAYHGPDNEYMCCSLSRNTSYKFRLQAQNEDGISRWSEEASFVTAAEPPAPPSRPTVKGRIHPHSFRLRWEPPHDTGGSCIKEYHLELDSGEGFTPIWSGPETEFLCDKLTPGASYRARISCANSGGLSKFSEPCVVVTEAVCPGICPTPFVVGKPRASSLQLKWGPPNHDGGSLVTQYEVNMINPDGSTRIAYIGRENECLVASLLPGRNYSFQVRASNRVGSGPWSELLETLSGPGVPEPPAQLQLTSRFSHSIFVSWNEPMNNGSTITEYRLEMAPAPKVKRSSSAGSLTLSTNGSSADDHTEDVDLERLQFTQLPNCGLAKSYDVKNLHPLTTYYFRVQAVNSVGASGHSPIACFTTLASSPASVSGLRCVEADTSRLFVSWITPNNHGSAITHYNIEVGDKLSFSTNGPETMFQIDGLNPDTQYKIRVQAVNAIGIGPFSSALKCSTLPLPPPPPKLECVLAGFNHLKLRWGDGRNLDFIYYSVEMQEEDREEFYLVYEGTSHSCRVSKLSESKIYKFRICARNDVGEGPYSEVKEFMTTRAPPPTLKSKPDVFDITEVGCRITWSAYRSVLPSDRVSYQVEVTRTKDQEQIVMERCHESELTVSCLEPRTEYSVRVCPVRLCEDGEIAGTYSPSKVFSTQFVQNVAPTLANEKKLFQIKERMQDWLTDQRMVGLISGLFIIFAVVVAFVFKQWILP